MAVGGREWGLWLRGEGEKEGGRGGRVCGLFREGSHFNTTWGAQLNRGFSLEVAAAGGHVAAGGTLVLLLGLLVGVLEHGFAGGI